MGFGLGWLVLGSVPAPPETPTPCGANAGAASAQQVAADTRTDGRMGRGLGEPKRPGGAPRRPPVVSFARLPRPGPARVPQPLLLSSSSLSVAAAPDGQPPEEVSSLNLERGGVYAPCRRGPGLRGRVRVTPPRSFHVSALPMGIGTWGTGMIGFPSHFTLLIDLLSTELMRCCAHT